MKRKHCIALLVSVGLAGAPAVLGAQEGTTRSPVKDTPVTAGGKGDSAASKQGSNASPVVVLVPFVFANDEKMAGGCWARLYESQNFAGNLLSLVGPVDVPNAKVGSGFEWGRKFDSVAVGPKATLTVYDNENYRQKTATFKPGQKVADLDEKMGMFENIRSLKIACS